MRKNKQTVVVVVVVILYENAIETNSIFDSKTHLKGEIYLNILEIEYFEFRDRAIEKLSKFQELYSIDRLQYAFKCLCSHNFSCY